MRLNDTKRRVLVEHGPLMTLSLENVIDVTSFCFYSNDVWHWVLVPWPRKRPIDRNLARRRGLDDSLIQLACLEHVFCQFRAPGDKVTLHLGLPRVPTRIVWHLVSGDLVTDGRFKCFALCSSEIV